MCKQLHCSYHICYNQYIDQPGLVQTWTLDYGLDYGLHFGLEFGLGWTVNSVLELLFKEDFEYWIA